MMCKKKAAVAVILAIALFLLPLKAAGAQEKQVLLIYDRVNYFGQQINQVNALEELLAGFPCSVKTLKQEEYKLGMERDYDLFIYLSLEGNGISSPLLAGLGNGEKKVFYLGKGIDQYLTMFPNPSAVYQGISSEITTITYQGKALPLDYPRGLPILQTSQSNQYGQLSDGKNQWPYIYHWGNFWYGAGYDSDIAVLEPIVKDVLEEILGPPLLQPLLTKPVQVHLSSFQESRSSLINGSNYFVLLLGVICLSFFLILTSSYSRLRRNLFTKES